MVCKTCKIDKDLSEFSIRYKDKGIYNKECKACKSEYNKIHYIRNKQKYLKKQKVNNKKYRIDFLNFKKTLKCSKCGDDRYYVLDFHHRDRSKKDFNVSRMGDRSLKRIMIEVNKCDILCANCHRELHHLERNIE